MSVPGVRGVDHIGLSVPDLDEAVRFFTVTFGAIEVYRHGPYPAGGESTVRQFARPADSAVEAIAMMRLGSMNIELLQYSTSDQRTEWPRTSDFGGHHLTFYVDDLAEAAATLREQDIEVLGDPMDLNGPERGPGAQFLYFRAPWGLFLELISYPKGRAYEQQTTRRLYDPRES